MLGTVIVGASHSGITCSDLLRKGGYSESITIIDQLHNLPVERPPLSKSFLLGGKLENSEELLIRPSNWYKKNNIHLKTGIEVLKINCSDKIIHLSDKSKIKYDKLVLATGAFPRFLNENITKLKGINILRTLLDAKNIKSKLNKLKNISIIGGGYIGLELAASLKKIGHSIKVIEMSDRLLSRVASPQLSTYFEKLHSINGVELFCDEIVNKIEIYNKQFKIITHKQKILSDIVIVGIGVIAETKLAKSAGLKCEDGIVVNYNYLTSDKNIFAIGDCAVNKDEYGMRIESVHNAQFSAMRASSYILNKLKPEMEVPWFWSDQFEVKLQSVGIFEKGSKTIFREGKRDGAMSWWSFSDGQLIAVEAVNDPQAFMIAKQIMQKKIKVNEDQIKSLKNNLKELIR